MRSRSPGGAAPCAGGRRRPAAGGRSLSARAAALCRRLPGPAPLRRRAASPGVRHLVSLSERAPPHHSCCPAIRLHRLRVPDFSPPTPGQIQSFLQLVEEATARGEAVAVHCMLGHGRTGTMLACYLAKAQKMSGGDAIREIRRLRPGSIETWEQEQAVIQFCQRIHAGEDSEEA
ncbi:dual specificity protein phosphatase 23 isoform X3 [Aptenodytes patagonicus]|uniref:dual specificity protein phosphatase 23 isoform X3 n=1 Tax=Aptenodytes patagonicus TaxID=9234 RepID=UPI003FA1889E